MRNPTLDLGVRLVRIAAGLAFLSLVGLDGGAARADTAATRSHYEATIRWTEFGIPHIEAKDFGGLGYGSGYAFAKDNACLLFDTVLTVRGERSKYLGAGGVALPGIVPSRNLESDVFFRSYFDVHALARAYEAQPKDGLALLKGYVAGVNRYLKDVGAAGLPAACRNAAWVRPLTVDDMFLLLAQKAVQASGSSFIGQLLNARPPQPGGGSPPVEPAPPQGQPGKPERMGSNAYALGRDLVQGGRGLMVANPHFPWVGHNRFFEMHQTIPGRLDVMGAALFPLPVVTIGFNRDVAWSHTVSTARHFTLFEVHLVPGQPLAYLVDGKPQAMQPVTVSVPVANAEGAPSTVTRTLYRTRYGFVVAEPALGLNWTDKTAFALADPMPGDTRLVEQWLRINRATNVAQIRQALADVQGVPWVNTLAADREGQVLYADYTAVPDVSDALLNACKGSPLAQAIMAQSGIPILDGSKAACDWQARGGSKAHPGLMPVDRLPSLIRSDFVLNSNDSFWLTNAAAPLTGYPSIVGSADRPQGFRTRMGYRALNELIGSKRGKLGMADMEAMILDDRNFAGELVMNDLAGWCTAKTGAAASSDADIASACGALRAWDRKDTTQSKGAAFFREFWLRALRIPSLWSHPFAKEEPLSTPAGLNLADPKVAAAIGKALKETVAQFRALGLSPEISLGAIQQRPVPGGAIPIPGGPDSSGVLNNLFLGPLTASGYDAAAPSGSSYIQVVTWNDAGPVADAVLTYGQSSDPDSPHYADQTRAYASGQWQRLPFSSKEIADAPVLKSELLRE